MGEGPAALLIDGTGTAFGTQSNPLSVRPGGRATDVTGDISAQYGYVLAECQGYESLGVLVTGTWSGMLIYQCSLDGGTSWYSGGFILPAEQLFPIPRVVSYLTESTTGAQLVGHGLSNYVRILAPVWVSGTAHVRVVRSCNAPALTTTISQVQQNVSVLSGNSSTTNLAAGASFTGAAESTLGISGIRVNCKADQPICTLCQQSTDGVNWDVADEQTFIAGEGDSRVFQSTSSFFRIVATNVGNAATTYFRLQVILCPVVEALPRALTPRGRLRLASMTDGFMPDPQVIVQRAQHQALLLDAERSLQIRGRVLTDEESFREDFASGLYNDQSGTFYFTNGSKIVTGVGTSFTSLGTKVFVKQSTHADSAYAEVANILSDDYLELADPYTGATASGTGRASKWQYTTTSGASVSQANSEISLITGTTSGAKAEIMRGGDYLPFVVGFNARITQRIANQYAHIGLGDDAPSTAAHQAFIVFSGTSNTQAILRTSSSSTDVEETTFTLPNGLVSSTSAYYQLEVTTNKVTLYVNDVLVAEHRLHIPESYATMQCRGCIENTGTAGSTTTLALNTFWLQNFNRVQIGTFVRGDPVASKEQRASKAATTRVSAAAADTQLLAPNPNRLSYAVYNDSVATLYLKHGSGASATSKRVALGRYDFYEWAGYTGQVNGYWSAATGAADVSEES